MKRVFLLLCSLATPALAASPVLSGLYAVGELALVDFSIADGKVQGRVRQSLQCVFPPDTQVVTGAFEGNVFVGTVTLCMEGCSAPPSVPMLGVFHGDSVAGMIHLAPGCSSPALDRQALFFRPATLEEKQRVLGNNAASPVAQKQKRAELAVIAAEAARDGNRLLGEQKYPLARERFFASVEAAETFEGLLGLAIAEIKLKHLDEAMVRLDRALTVGGAAGRSSAQLSQVHYNRACVQVALNDKREALNSLRLAVRLAGPQAYLADLTEDPDLQPLRADGDFRRFVADVQLQARKRTR